MAAVMSSKSDWRVHVLCAQWCGVCRDYRSFVELQQLGSAAQWVWVDIEAQSDLLGDLDIENFPTLLITQGDDLRFLGTVTPQPEVAERLLQSLLDGNRYPVADAADLAEVTANLKAL
jgi:thioredoxin 1